MSTSPYAARLDVEYPASLDRVSTALRFLYIIPIAIILSLVTDGCQRLEASRVSARQEAIQVMVQLREHGVIIPPNVADDVIDAAPTDIATSSGAVTGGLFAGTLLMILFRRRYPRWWFEFSRELTRFSARVAAYGALLTDRYPSTEEEQAVHIDIDYPDAARLNRWLPLVKWFLAIPHYLVLCVLGIGAVFSVIIAWFAIVFTGRYPRALFEYVVGVARWFLRVQAYAFLLVTDEYPPFSLRP